MAKVVINGLVVEGSYEDIQRILGIQSVSVRTNTVAMQQTNNVDVFYDNANLVQRQEQVVELGKATSKDVETKYTVEKCGNSLELSITSSLVARSISTKLQARKNSIDLTKLLLILLIRQLKH